MLRLALAILLAAYGLAVGSGYTSLIERAVEDRTQTIERFATGE